MGQIADRDAAPELPPHPHPLPQGGEGAIVRPGLEGEGTIVRPGLEGGEQHHQRRWPIQRRLPFPAPSPACGRGLG